MQIFIQLQSSEPSEIQLHFDSIWISTNQLAHIKSLTYKYNLYRSQTIKKTTFTITFHRYVMLTQHTPSVQMHIFFWKTYRATKRMKIKCCRFGYLEYWSKRSKEPVNDCNIKGINTYISLTLTEGDNFGLEANLSASW